MFLHKMSSFLRCNAPNPALLTTTGSWVIVVKRVCKTQKNPEPSTRWTLRRKTEEPGRIEEERNSKKKR